MLLQVQLDHRLDSGTLLGVEVTAPPVLSERPVCRTGPGLERRRELTLVDQANLEREHAEQEVMVGR